MKPIYPVLALLFVVACGKKDDVIKPTKTDIVESVYASAKIKALHQYVLRPSISGKISQYFFKEGDSIGANQTIAILENTSPELNLQNASEAVSVAKENLLQLQEYEQQLNSAQKQYSLDSINYKRQSNLWSKEIGSKSQLDAATLKYQMSKGTYLAAKTRFQILRRQLSGALKQAQNNQSIAKRNATDFELKSVVEGRIYSLNYELGEMVGPTTEFAVIGSSNQFYIEMEIDEVDVAKIQLGQEVILKLEAYNTPIKAKVSRIDPAINSKTQTFTVEATFTGEIPKLYPGLTAEANIVIQTKKSALTIPLNYLIDDEFVMVGNEKKKVKTGLRNFQLVEILEGIDESTAVTKPK